MIQWEDNLSVGISIIDQQHKEFIEIINKAIFTIGRYVNPEEVEDVLGEMLNYSHKHFSTEETYMKEFNYPDYEFHTKEHSDFSTKTNAFLDSVIRGDYHIANDILEHLEQWLVSHIQKTDRNYIDCFKENGLK